MPRWSIPAFPVTPADDLATPPTVLTVDDAFLTRVEHGPLATPTPPRRWLRGAVHDAAGDLVKPSQKLCVGANNWVAADPRSVRVDRSAELLAGRWLYGGHWMQHFGHFVAETLTTLWPDPRSTGEIAGLVFHKYLKRPWTEDPWQRRLLDLAGYAGVPVHVVDGRAGLRVESLLVPERSLVAHGWARPEARQVWDRIVRAGRAARVGRRACSCPGPATTSCVGREGHRSADRSTAEWDAGVDAVFAAAGFEVARPETLTIDDQLALVADAALVAGVSGSALHLSAFAPAAARVLEIGDLRSPHQPVAMQLSSTPPAGTSTPLCAEASRWTSWKPS